MMSLSDSTALWGMNKVLLQWLEQNSGTDQGGKLHCQSVAKESHLTTVTYNEHIANDAWSCM